ncbi:MAG: hypothetical protein HYR56_02335 [Acidobacteria bacterium]|nr:hypothetical protein [Acidobacteriota bacterium]MBI3421349.1 hypothetical protein [Acidobacteriota bacterium]
MWNPLQHSDEENTLWSWLRAVEWGRWPIFMSQPLAPIALLFLSWKAVVLVVVTLNILWAMLIRYNFVSVSAADFGVIFIRLKWLVCPMTCFYLYHNGETTKAAVALFWPLIIFVIGIIPTVQVGRIQKMFMYRLGYEFSESGIKPKDQKQSDATQMSNLFFGDH